MKPLTKLQHGLYIVGLMIAGESIYMLPYMRKTFQTTMESVFQVTSAELGLLNSMFGILALICYFPSGWLADRFSARNLLVFSLMATGFGGMGIFASSSYTWLLGIHAFWGITTILTFWSALIKATRSWGKTDNQGLTFGLLAAGRGAVAAILATLATTVFAQGSTPEDGLYYVITLYSSVPLLAAIIIWWVIPKTLHESSTQEQQKAKTHRPKVSLSKLTSILQKPEVWLLSLIIFSAYFIYIGTFDFPAFAERGYNRTKTFGAILGTIRDWMRPLAALGAGLLADKFRPSKIIGLAFSLLVLSFASLFFVQPDNVSIWIYWIQISLASLAVFGIRGIYFSMLEEIKIPHESTGLVVGIISFIGFTPDIFGYWISGTLTDTYGPTLGHQIHFLMLSGLALIGLLSTLFISRVRRPVHR